MSTQTVKALLVTETAEGKTKNQTFSHINPQASDSSIANALQQIGTLQKNIVKGYQRVATSVITP